MAAALPAWWGQVIIEFDRVVRAKRGMTIAEAELALTPPEDPAAESRGLYLDSLS